MSYTKNNWANGDTITAEKLNHAESGIFANDAAAAAAMPLDVPVTVTMEDDTPVATTDASFATVKAAVVAGRNVRSVITLPGGYGILYAPLVAIDAADPTILDFAVTMDLGTGVFAPEIK